MKAYVLKTKNGKYIDCLEENIGSLNMATLWSTKRDALEAGLSYLEFSWPKIVKTLGIKAVKIEIKELK